MGYGIEDTYRIVTWESVERLLLLLLSRIQAGDTVDFIILSQRGNKLIRGPRRDVARVSISVTLVLEKCSLEEKIRRRNAILEIASIEDAVRERIIKKRN